MDLDIYDYQKAFGITLGRLDTRSHKPFAQIPTGMTKAERLQSSESSMTHAMVITAVHLDGEGNTVRFKVENSWGETFGDQGFFVMTDKWFDEFVYQVVVPRNIAPKNLVSILDKGDAKVLPAWDPMVSLSSFDYSFA